MASNCFKRDCFVKSIPDVFSAGLDISVLSTDHPAEFDKMWTALQNLWLRVYCSPLAIIAAINGSAPAGGCMISIACDHRIMAQGKYHIGISAPRLGIPVPAWVTRTMQNTIGQRHAESMLEKATLCSVDEALNIGLIDKVVEQEKLKESAEEEMTKMLKIPDGKRQQPHNTQNTRRRVTRCSARQRDKAAADLTTPVQVQLGEKIDLTKSEITILEDTGDKITLTKVAEFSYVIGGNSTLPTLRSRSRQRAENMSRYNNPPRYYNPRDRDYGRDNYYAPPSQQFERRQVAKKSTAQQAQVHQYGHKRPPGPDFHHVPYKRPRVSHGDDYRYHRGMSPPEYEHNRNGVDSWRGRRPPPPRGRPHRRSGRPPKFPRRHDFSQNDRGNNDFDGGRGPSPSRAERSRGSEPKRTEESSKPKRTKESAGSQSQEASPSRGRRRPPKPRPSSQDSSENSSSRDQADPQSSKSAVDKGSPHPSKPAVVKDGPQASKSTVAKGSPQPAKSAVAKSSLHTAKTAVIKGNTQPAKPTEAKGSPHPAKPTVAKSDTQPAKAVTEKVTSNRRKPNQIKTASKTVVNNSINSNASSPSKKAAGNTVVNHDKSKQMQSSIKVKANARKSTYSPKKIEHSDEQVLGPDADVEWKVLSETSDSDDAKQTRSSKAKLADGRVSALDNALRIERIRKEEEAKSKAAEAAARKESVSSTETNAYPGSGEATVNNTSEDVQKTNSATRRTAARKSLPNLARKMMPTLANKATISAVPSASAVQTKSLEVPKESAQANNGKQGMARKSSPKSSNQKSSSLSPSENEDDGKEKSTDVQESDQVNKPMSGPTTDPTFKPFGPRITASTRKSAPASSNSPAKKLTRDTSASGAARLSDQKSDSSSQSARTAPGKDTARKSALLSSNAPKSALAVTLKTTARKSAPVSSTMARKSAPVSSTTARKSAPVSNSASKPTSEATLQDTAGKSALSSSNSPNATSSVTPKDTARKSAPPSSNALKPSAVVTPEVHSTSSPSEESSNTAPDQQDDSRSQSLQSARTVPIKQLHPPKNLGGNLKTSNAQVMPTTRKTTPTPSEQPENLPEVRMPIQPKTLDSAPPPPPSEQAKRSPEVRMPVQPKNLDSIDAALNDGLKDKAKGLKTFNLPVFKSDKLKNILGKVYAKREAKNDSLVNDATIASTAVNIAVDKKELIDKKANLLKEPIDDKTLTKVKKMLPDLTHFEAPCEKLKGANKEEEQKNVKNEVKNEVKSEASTTKQETKETILLNVPQFQKSVDSKDPSDVKEPKEESKVDGARKADSLKLEVKSEISADQSNTKMNLTKEEDTVKPIGESSAQQVAKMETTLKPEPVKSNTTVQFVVGAKSPLPKPPVADATEQVAQTPSINNASTKTNVNASLETAESTVKDVKAGELAQQRKDEKAGEVPSKDVGRSSSNSEKVSVNAVEHSVKVGSLQAETKSTSEVEKATEVKVTDIGKAGEKDAVAAKPSATDAIGNGTSSSTTSSKPQTESAKQMERIEGHKTDDDKAMSPWARYKSRHNESAEASPTTAASVPIVDKKAVEESATASGGNPPGSNQLPVEAKVNKASDSGSSAEVTPAVLGESAGLHPVEDASSKESVADQEVAKTSETTSAVEQLRQKSLPTQKEGNQTAKLPSSSLAKTVVSRSSPARTSGESYSSDNALLLNSSTNDSAKEPMDVDSDSLEMDDYLLADDDVQGKEKSSMEGDKKELLMDTAKKAGPEGGDSTVPLISEKEATQQNVPSESSLANTSKTSSKPEASPASEEQVSKPTPPTVVPDAALQKEDSTQNTPESNAAQDGSASEQIPSGTEAPVSSGLSDQQKKPSIEEPATKEREVAAAEEKVPVEPSALVPTPVHNQNKASTSETTTNVEGKTSLPSEKTSEESATNSSQVTSAIESKAKTSVAAETRVPDKPVHASHESNDPSKRAVEAEQEKVEENRSMEKISSSVSADKLVEPKPPSDKPSEEKTVEQKEAIQTVTPVSGKVTPSVTAEEQSKSSRSATPSATNDSSAENDLDIIELSSGDNENKDLSASGKTKLKKKRPKPKPGSEQGDGSSSAGKRSASPQQVEGKAKKKAKLDEVEERVDLSSLSKPELFTKLIEMKKKQHLKKYMDLAAQAKALKEQLAASESSRQKWQMESTRLQIKVHKLTEQNNILSSQRKDVPRKGVVATGTQYNRVDVLQAQQMLAGTARVTAAATTSAAKQSLAVAPSPSTPQMRVAAQQVSHPPAGRSQATVGPSHPQQRSVASDVSRPNPMLGRPGASIASPMRPTAPQAVNTMAGSPTAGGAVRAPVTPHKQPDNPFHQQQPQSQPLNLQSPGRSTCAPVATSPLTSSAGGGFQASVRPPAPTAKPGDIRAKSSAAKRPAAPAAVAGAPNPSASVDCIDLTDDDESNKAAAAAKKGRVPPLNPVRTPQGDQVRGPSQQVGPKTPPAAHSRSTPPRASLPSAATSKQQQQQPAGNILRGTVATSKPGQLQQTASSQLAEFTQAHVAQQQQGQQVQILQTVQRGQIPSAGQQQRQVVQQPQQPQRSIATQQVSPNVVVSQARVPPMQTRTVTLPVAGGGTQLVRLPGNAATATLPARGVAPILQQGGQPQQAQLQQVIPPGAQIIQTPTGQVVMAPAMSSGVTTVLTTQPIQAGGVQYQIVNSQGATVQQMLQIQQQQQQQQQQQATVVRTAQVIGTRFAAPAGTSPNVQQDGHVIHHRGPAPRPPTQGHSPRMARAPAPQVQQQQSPPYPQQQRRPSFSEPGTMHAIAAPATSAASNAGQTEVQKQIANIQAQIAQFEALAQNAQQSIQKLKGDDEPYEKRRIEIMKQLLMGNHENETQELHLQLRHIQSEQTRIQTESKAKVGVLQQYQHSKCQLQQNLQQLQRQQAVGQQRQQQAVQQQQIAQVNRLPASAPSTAVVPSNPRRHPAPLPTVQNPNVSMVSNAAPPPKPTLSISKVNQGIVLSWNMTIDTHQHAPIDFYNLYAYQETDAAPNTSLWKKIGEVKALPLPMACTLTQFQPGSMYHFAVCAIDIYHRTGPFSDPSSINLPAV